MEEAVAENGAGEPVRTDSSCWTRADFGESRSWARRLKPEMLKEIDAAIVGAVRRGLDFSHLSPKDFPLPHTSKLLLNCLSDLESGRGFTVIEGFPAENYSVEENFLAHAGISSYLGTIVAQNHLGEKIIEIVDRDEPYSHKSRGYHSRELLPFHTDGADWAGLLCIGTAEEGGLSVISSSASVHNAILSERPDLYEVLLRGFFHHRRGEQTVGEPPVSSERIPVFSFYNGLLHTTYNRNPIDWVVHEGIELSSLEIEALDFFDSVVARPDLQIQMELRRGDIQYINNFAILHSRGSYRDTLEERRHLLRIWLNYSNARRVGPTLLDLYAPEEIDKRRDL